LTNSLNTRENSVRRLHCQVVRQDTFQTTIGNGTLHKNNDDNGDGVVNFATPRNLIVKSTMFPHQNIDKFTWTSIDGKSPTQIDHILTERRRHSTTLGVLSFRAGGCGTDHCLVVTKVERD
jgi:hypothetical protein